MAKGSIPRSRTGKALDYLKNRSDIARAIRGAGQFITNPPSLTGPITEADAARSFNVASMFAGGGGMFRRPAGSIGTGGRPYKVSGAVPKTPVKKVPVPKPGNKKFIGPTRPTQSGEKGFIGPTQPPKAGQAGFIGPTRPATTSSGPKKRLMSKKDAAVVGATAAASATSVASVLTAGYISALSPSAKKNIVGNNPNRGLAQTKAKAKGGGPIKRQGSQAPSMAKKKTMGTGAAPPGGPPSGKRMKKNNGAFTLGTGAQTTGVATGTTSSKPVAPKPRLRPMASAKKEMTFQEATRRNQSDEYLRKKMRPKGNLLSLFRNR